MEPIRSSELAAFARKYRFAQGRLRGVRFRMKQGVVSVELSLIARRTGKLNEVGEQVKLKLLLIDVEEYRFQKRLNMSPGKISELRLGYFNGLIYLNLDAWTGDPGEILALHDFRASEAYAGGKTLQWMEVKPKPKPKA